jgi:hypothetical protein
MLEVNSCNQVYNTCYFLEYNMCLVVTYKYFLLGYTRPSTLDPRLICPVFDVIFPFLPEKILKPLRFGVPHKKVKQC